MRTHTRTHTRSHAHTYKHTDKQTYKHTYTNFSEITLSQYPSTTPIYDEEAPKEAL